MKVLAIIDMQKCFLRRRDVRKCVRPIRNLIRHFKIRNWPILLVEMLNEGDTIPILGEQVSERVVKSRADGSGAIIKKCKRERWPLNFVLCGIYADRCVRGTAIGLISKGSVTIIEEATRPFFPRGSRESSPRHEREQKSLGKVKTVSSRQFYKEMRASQRS